MIALTSSQTKELSAQLLDQLIEKCHPLLAEGIYLASIAHSYDLSCFAALRAQDDGLDERLVKRLARFSFINSVSDPRSEHTSIYYQMQRVERDLLQRRWIERDREAYLATQQRAAQFWQAKRLGEQLFMDSFTLKQNRIYHLLIVAPNEGIALLSDTFRDYLNHRFLAAIERLLLTAHEALTYLELLQAAECAELADLLLLSEARLAQLRGQWQASLQIIRRLRQKESLTPRLLPYVVRSYALGLLHTEQYVEAINQFEQALKLFSQSTETAEAGYTMIALGDTYVKFATSARGYRDRITSPKTRLQEWIRGFISLPILPVMLYLSSQRLHLWHPASWHALQKQDWIIARLFATGADWYRRADDLLEQTAERSEWGHADRKLAWLYLIMGESRMAVSRFKDDLANQTSQLSEYNKAAIEVGLASGLLQLGQLNEAKDLLINVLPLLALYEDRELQAAGFRNLAEIYVEEGQPSEALEPYGQAMHLYQQHKEFVSATEIAERLWELEEMKLFNEQESEKIAALTQELYSRQYIVRFQKKSLVIFGRMTVILLAFLAFLLPMLLIKVDTTTRLQLQLNFAISPPISVDFGNFSPLNFTLMPKVQVGTNPFFSLEPVFKYGIAVILIYLFIYTLFGIVIIARTKLATVQKAAERLAIQVDDKSITIGNQADGTAQTIYWADVTTVVIADLKWFGHAMSNHALTIIATPSQQLVIRGSTASYSSLQKQIQTFIPAKTHLADLSYTLLRSRTALLYALGLMSLLLFVILNRLAPKIINTQLLNSPYTLIELYPYFYLALLWPPFWWFLVRPFSILARIGRLEPLIWWPIALGTCWHIISDGLNWLPHSNIYAPLITLIFLSTALAALWERPLLLPLPEQPQWLLGINQILTLKRPKLLLSILLAVMILDATTSIITQVRAAHYLSQGNYHLKEATVAKSAQKKTRERHLAEALAAYTQNLALSQNVFALRGRAATLIQMNRFSEAFQDYEQAEQKDADKAMIYAEKAVAYQIWSLNLPESEYKHQLEQSAIQNFDEAIQHDNKPDYYLGRGIAYQATGQWDKALENYQEMLHVHPNNSQALIALGWFYLAQGNLSRTQAFNMQDEAQESLLEEASQHYKQALESFQQPHVLEHSSVELWLAIGYAQYRLQDYSEALKSWAQAVELEPDNIIARTSRASAYWQLATLKGAACKLQTNDPIAQEEQKLKIHYLEEAINDLSSSALKEKPDAFNYRTRAQLSYLLRDCPKYSKQKQLRKAIKDYQLAILLDQDNSVYWQYLARLQTALHLNLRNNQKQAQEAYHLLSSAAKAIERSYELEPNDQDTQIWRNTHIPTTALEQGNDEYAQGNYQLAQAYFEIVLISDPTHVEAAAKAAVAAFAQGNSKQAADHINQALNVSQKSDIELLRTMTDEMMRLVRDLSEARLRVLRKRTDDLELTTDTLLDMYRELRRKQELASAGANQAADVRAELSYIRAEFDFQLAFQVFRLEDKPAAREILEGAIIDINKAALLDSRYQERRDFFTEAAYGWFYLRRGDNAYNNRDYEYALSDYEEAARILLPGLPITARDATKAHFSAGLTSLALNELQQATEWYQKGIQLAQEHKQAGILHLARLKLNALIQMVPQLEAEAKEISQKLIEAQRQLEQQ